MVIKVPQFPPTVFLTSNIAQVRIRVTAGKGDRSGKEPLHSNLWFFTSVKQGRVGHSIDCGYLIYIVVMESEGLMVNRLVLLATLCG